MRYRFEARSMDNVEHDNYDIASLENCELVDFETGRTAKVGDMYLEEISGDDAITLALILNALHRKQCDEMERRYEERIAREGQ